VAQASACGGWSEHGHACCNKNLQTEACATQTYNPWLFSDSLFWRLGQPEASDETGGVG
jgi:hypothetical protein